MTVERLLAKSCREGKPLHPSLTLCGHLADVHRAAGKVLTATGDDQLQALGLPVERYRERLERCVLLAAATHDLGKANDHFEGMLSGARSGQPQGLRHEWVTLLLLEMPALRRWLLPAVGNDEADWHTVLWSIAGHHPAYGRPSPPRLFVEGGGPQIEVHLDHPDFTACLCWLQEVFALTAPPVLARQTWPLIGPDNAFERIYRWFQQATGVWARLSGEERRFVGAVKDALVAADVAGSALPRAVRDGAAREGWIEAAFAQRPTADRLRRIVDRRRGGQPLRPFQEQVGRLAAPVALVRAGCGTGKTQAAYHWAACQHPGRRLYFCYPTTGTATEGFRDYLYDPDAEIDADLFHGRAAVDLEVVLMVQEENDRAEAGGLARIESLDAWSTPVASCTVDTVLGLVQNNRRGLYAWPALAGAAVVFDEIHAYDDPLFGALLRFLQALPGVPVLLMTASLPRARLESLRQCLRRRNVEMPEIAGPPEMERLPRYQRHGPVNAHDPFPRVKTEIERGGKVLWVCNTVERARAVAERAGELNPLVYHSRFRYEDRVRQHRRVIEVFRSGEPALAVCTQVAEMSLDLSATLLVSDLAPVPALIQRLGRLNRWAREGDPPRPFVVLEPLGDDGKEAVLPYSPEDFRAARAWLEALGEAALSQEDLARCWEQHEAGGRPAFVASAWLDGGPVTQVLELRAASPGLTVVLERDEEGLKAGRFLPARVALPMPPPPRGVGWQSWRRFQAIPVAPEGVIEYDAERGARWRRSRP